MNKAISYLIFLMLLIHLGACSTTGDKRFIPIKPHDGQSTVYIYRPASISNAMYSPDIHIDGEFKLTLKPGMNISFTLPSGEHTFELISQKKFPGTKKVTLDLTDGNIYYLRIDTSLKIKSALDYEPYQRSFSLITVGRNRASEEITECCTKTEVTDKIKPETSLQKPSDGFSVEKTNNPFSH